MGGEGLLNRVELLKKYVSSRITVVIPTLNEEENIAEVIKECNFVGFSDILVIDGNSHDSTAKVAKELGANVIYQCGKGKGDAIRKAFAHEELGDYVVMLDADGSMDPKEIQLFLMALQNGSDIVKGSRFMPNGYSEDMTTFRRIGNKMFISIVNLLMGTKFTDLCYGYAAFSKEAIQKIHPHLTSPNFEIETELFIKASQMGFKIREVPSLEHKRKNGKSHLKAFTDGFKILKTILLEFLRNPMYNKIVPKL